MSTKTLVRLAAFSITFTFALAFVPVALAQDVAPIPNPDNIEAMAQLIWDAIMNKQWGVVASLGVMFIIAALRKWVPSTTKVGAWFKTKLGAIITNFVLALSGALATALLSGHAISAPLIIKAIGVALGASGGWAILKNVSEAIDEARAQKAGEAAAADPGPTLDK
jgi:hypothetical protein